MSALHDFQIEALGRLLPALLCGEESSFQVFWQESRRLSDLRREQSRALAYRIATEELEHDRLLHDLRRCCPISSDEASIRFRARRFFLRMAARNVALHFARIAALDSAVCIVLGTLIKPLVSARGVIETFKRIRADESRHVKFSRQHVYELGGDRAMLDGSAAYMRSELMTMLYPLGNSFEQLGIDADSLLREHSSARARSSKFVM